MGAFSVMKCRFFPDKGFTDRNSEGMDPRYFRYPYSTFCPLMTREKCSSNFSAARRAQEHALHENFKVVHHRGNFRVQIQFQHDARFIVGDLDAGGVDGVIDAVVNVEGGEIPVAYAGAAHVGFIRQDDGRRHGVNGEGGALVVVCRWRW